MTGSRTSARVLVVGAGLIGTPIIEALRARGIDVLSVCRSPRPEPHLRADLSTEEGRERLAKTLHTWRPDRAVLVHGPGDVTWMEDNEHPATVTHAGTAQVVSGIPTVLISTNNVFDGTAGCHEDTDAVRPLNAYGRVKLAAERALDGGPAPVIMRVSMVFGPRRSGRTELRQRLAGACPGPPGLRGADRSAPHSHLPGWTTSPRSWSRSCRSAAAGHAASGRASPAQPLRAGQGGLPGRGPDPDLVRGVPRAQTSWACRPAYSSLTNSDFSALPGLRDFVPRDVPTALAELVSGSSGR